APVVRDRRASPSFTSLHPRSPTLGPVSCTAALEGIAFPRCLITQLGEPQGADVDRLPKTTAIGQIHSSTIQEMTMNASTFSIGLRGLIATAIFGALASSFSAVSAADAGSAGVTVKYADLNIASPSGALVLYERIRAAAQSACSYFWFKTDADEARCL